LEDESILISYTQRSTAPSRLYVIRFGVNKERTGIELLSLGES